MTKELREYKISELAHRYTGIIFLFVLILCGIDLAESGLRWSILGSIVGGFLIATLFYGVLEWRVKKLSDELLDEDYSKHVRASDRRALNIRLLILTLILLAMSSPNELAFRSFAEVKKINFNQFKRKSIGPFFSFFEADSDDRNYIAILNNFYEFPSTKK